MPAGTHMGLNTMIKGEKKIMAITVAATVRPVRRSKIAPVTRRVKRPASWVEFGAWSWYLRRNAEDGGVVVEVGVGLGVGLSAMVERV